MSTSSPKLPPPPSLTSLKKSEINICFAINDTYLEPLMVTLYSLLKSNGNSTFRFYVISNNLSESSQTRLRRFLEKFPHADIEFVSVDASRFQDLTISIDYITLETYFRYVLAELFPSLDKILYLDADLIVVGDITDLWNTELGANYAAGVHDIYIERISYKQEIGLEESDLYINAGVILFNLDAIRKGNIVPKFFEQTGRMFRFQDQDVLNVVCRKKIVRVPDKFNVLFGEKSGLSRSASIIHYTGRRKPWLPNTRSKRAFDFIFRHRVWKNRRIYRKVHAEMLNQEAKKNLIVTSFSQTKQPQ